MGSRHCVPDGVDAPPGGIAMCQDSQVHGATADAPVAYRRKLSRGKLMSLLASQPPCTVAMEARASAAYWVRPGPGGAR